MTSDTREHKGGRRTFPRAPDPVNACAALRLKVRKAKARGSGIVVLRMREAEGLMAAEHIERFNFLLQGWSDDDVENLTRRMMTERIKESLKPRAGDE